MTRPWNEIGKMYAQYSSRRAASMGSLAGKIENSRYAQGLFPWTSHFILCIAQMPVEYPYRGPYLRIEPVEDGAKLDFRYVDTYQEDRQWHRTVDSADGFDRLERFIQQLHWFPPQ